MKQFRIKMLLLTASILLCACPGKNGGPPYIRIINNSKKDIACQSFRSGRITEADTIFQCNLGATRIEADSLYNYPSRNIDRGGGWYNDFTAIPYIQLLIMDCDTYWHYHSEPCDTIRKYVPVLHVYRLTQEDLERMNWTVVYPPEE